jgi:CubicO group peptidase (beta-lactamase class C family)
MSQRRSISFLFILTFIFFSCKSSTTAPDIIPPNLNLPESLSAIANEEFTHIIDVSDPQSQRVNLLIDGLPGWLEFIPSQKLLKGTPSPEDTGRFELKITADNGTSRTEERVTLVVFSSQGELKLHEKIGSILRLRAPGLRGLSVAVVDENGQLYAAYTGHMGTSNDFPAYERNTMFRIASVNKPMTAAVVLKLVEERRISLDDYLINHFETGLQNAGRMRIRHLLSHTAGVYDHLNSSAFWSSAPLGTVWSLDSIINLAIQNGPLFTPGQSYHYSNTGFCVLGALVENVTGLPIKDAYQQYLINPLGLDHTLYDNFSNANNTIPGLAISPRTYEYHLTSAGPAGAMVASPSDVARFGWEVYGGRFINESLTNLMSVNYGAQLGGQNYGLGTRIWTVGGVRHHGHTGNLMSYRNILIYIPQIDASIAIHSHESHAAWNSIVDDIFDYVLDNFASTAVKRLPYHLYESETRDDYDVRTQRY